MDSLNCHPGIDYYADYHSTITALRNELGLCHPPKRRKRASEKPDVDGILPVYIFCPERSRSAIGSIDFTDCEAESDLPERFLLGRLVPGSFNRLPTGFSIRYASSHIDALLSTDGDRLQFEVKVERSNPYYHVRHCSKTDWNSGLLPQLSLTKSELDQGLGSVLETDFNVRYKCGQLSKNLGDVCYLPDGYAVSVLVPFPINDASCSNLQRFVRAIMDGPAVWFQAHLELQVIVSNYCEGQCPDLKLEAKELLVRDVDRGLIPFGIPKWEGDQGNRALTIGRIGYVLVIRTFLYDLGGILEYLRDCDLIHEVSTSEQFAHIHDRHAEECLESCAGFSRDRSRRVVLGFTNPRPPSGDRVPDNSFNSFTEKLEETHERMEEIKQILARKLAGHFRDTES